MKPYRITLLILFATVGLWSAIHPASLGDWALESSPSILAIVLIAFFDRQLRLSNVSFTFLVIYFSLAFVNAHYGVAHVPFGDTLGKWFGSNRNMYDRLVHFASGLLCVPALREVWVRSTGEKKFWSYAIPFISIMGLGALYEIGELFAKLAHSSNASTFVGAQGDLWDSPKDLLCAAIGALLSITIVLCLRLIKQQKPR